MERVDHVHVVQVGGGRLIRQIYRVLQWQVPDGERLVLGVARPDAPPVVVVQLAQAGGHLAAAGAGRGDNDQGAGRLDVFVLAQPLVGHDVRHVGGVACDGVVLVALHAQRAQPLDKRVRRRLTGVLGDDHAAHIEAQTPEHVDQPQHIRVVADAQIAPHLVLFDIPGADGHHDLHIVLQRLQHPDLAVRLEARQHAGGVVVIKQLAAELQIQLAAELRPPRRDVLRLQLQVLLIVKSDLHPDTPLSLQNSCPLYYTLWSRGRKNRKVWQGKCNEVFPEILAKPTVAF